MKQHGLHFCMDDRVPGYTLQDRMIELGHDVVFLAPRKIFRYLDHIQAGTVAAAGGYANVRRCPGAPAQWRLAPGVAGRVSPRSYWRYAARRHWLPGG
jgi:hypothetical protein